MGSPVDVQQAFTNLAQILRRQGSARLNYTFSDQLADAVETAVGVELQGSIEPTMLYKGGSRTDVRTVRSMQELKQAENDGFVRQCGPQFAEGYPASFVEPPVAGGPSDRRRIPLHNAEEEAQWRKVTNDGEGWVRDDAHMYGGRGTPLSELVDEHEARLQRKVSEDLRRK